VRRRDGVRDGDVWNLLDRRPVWRERAVHRGLLHVHERRAVRDGPAVRGRGLRFDVTTTSRLLTSRGRPSRRSRSRRASHPSRTVRSVQARMRARTSSGTATPRAATTPSTAWARPCPSPRASSCAT
jgi:hypothetical protein